MRKSLFSLLAFFSAVSFGAAAPRERRSLGGGPDWFPVKQPVELTDWKSVKALVPADWKGSRVVFDVPYALSKCDMIVSVNGEYAGDILRPAGSLDVSDKVRYGAENTFSWRLSASGAATKRGVAQTVEKVHRVQQGLTRPPDLVKTPKAYLADVFANTSWRQHKVTFECEPVGEGTVEIEVLDADGKVVKRGKGRERIEIPWTDPVCWELGRPYLYTCRARFGEDELSFRFGFREVWREGKEIMMNGHKAHLRPCYPFGVQRHGMEFLQDIGYNVIGWFHSGDSVAVSDERNARLDTLDELGMGVFVSCGAGLNIVRGRPAEDPETARLYRDFQKTFHRYTRNHPSVLAGYVAQMIICATGAHDPTALGLYEANGPRDRLVNLFRDVNREYNPNILYYSHADGNNGDIASGNLYLNFTPLQEREEWLSNWATNGVMPWCSVEFGQPYDGNWWKGMTFLPTEYLAMQFGERAYLEEPAELMPLLLGAAEKNKYHGTEPGFALLPRYPLFWEMRRNWTWRTNSRWRGFGHGGGNVYFNLKEAYGTPPGGKAYQRYEAIHEPLAHRKPDWANEAYDIHQLGNKDFCAFVGDTPLPTDRTHAYYAGEKIAKQVVLIWDGVGEKKVEVKVEVKVKGEGLGEGQGQGWRRTLTATLKQGDIVKLPFEFAAPEVARKTDFAITADFGNGITDEFPFEVCPKGAAKVRVPAKTRLALFDPTGESAGVLKNLGLGFVTVKSLAGGVPTDCNALVIGRNALAKSGLGVRPEQLKAGLKVLILPQDAKTWRAFGFNVIDGMSREVVARAPGFRSLPADLLRHWRGAPAYGDRPYGHVMTHTAPRGPRWTRNHVVAGLMLEPPARVGFAPLMEGEFDLAYSPLLRFFAGKGSLTFCTLDFEGRVGPDPAATETAKAVFGEWLASKAPAPKADPGATLSLWADPKAVTADGVYRAVRPDDPAYAFVGPQLLRWSVPVPVRPAADGAFTLAAEAFAKKVGTVPAVDREMYALNAMRAAKLFARVRTAAGVPADDLLVRRMTYLAGGSALQPLPAFHAVGPFAAGKDDSKLMLDTVWDRQVEEMAIAGDDNPNFEFKLPQGGTANWRRIVMPDAEGCFDFGKDIADALNPVHYATVRIRRKTAGPARLKLGADWRFRLWVNGRPVFETLNGAHYPKFEHVVDLKAGENVLAVKLGGGRSGCKLWALLEDEDAAQAAAVADPELEAVTLYDNLIPGFDPYAFHYW